ncbi:MAG: hypothetical protein ACR2RL_22885 [Gammaproteobacteria bacterium]
MRVVPSRYRERPISHVPVRVLAVLAFALAAQIAVGWLRPAPTAAASSLEWPPQAWALRLAAVGEPLVAAKVLMLRLQAFDNQKGLSVPFARLDYERVVAWLDALLELDPKAQYPLLAASRVYTLVRDQGRVRIMLDFVRRRFVEAPDLRWPWMAHAALVARHRLHDEQLALALARELTEHAKGPDVPGWARDMSVLLLADLGEVERARVLMGGLIQSGRLTDPNEIEFMARRLEEAEREKGTADNGGSVSEK